MRDVTTRHAAEERARLLERAVESSANGVVICDARAPGVAGQGFDDPDRAGDRQVQPVHLDGLGHRDADPLRPLRGGGGGVDAGAQHHELVAAEPRDEIGVVFQRPTLLPWLTVQDNITGVGVNVGSAHLFQSIGGQWTAVSRLLASDPAINSLADLKGRGIAVMQGAVWQEVLTSAGFVQEQRPAAMAPARCPR